MSVNHVTKVVQFGEHKFELITFLYNGEILIFSSTFAKILGYHALEDWNNVFQTKVSKKNQHEYQDLNIIMPTNVFFHPKSKFINEAGLSELIDESKMPKADEFRLCIKDAIKQLRGSDNYNQRENDGPSTSLNAVKRSLNDQSNEVEVLRKIQKLSEEKQEINNKLIQTKTRLEELQKQLNQHASENKSHIEKIRRQDAQIVDLLVERERLKSMQNLILKLLSNNTNLSSND